MTTNFSELPVAPGFDRAFFFSFSFIRLIDLVDLVN